MKYSQILFCIATILLCSHLTAAYKLDISNIHKGEYSYSYETDDGTIMENREGKIDENGDKVVTGSYTFLIGDSEYTVTYTADNNGYHPRITISKVPEINVEISSTAVASLLG